MSSNAKMTGEVDRLVGSRVRSRRLELGLSQQKLAAALGLTFPQVQKYENGRNRISVSRLQQIALILQMSMADLIQGLDGSGDVSGSAPSQAGGLGQERDEVEQLWSRLPAEFRPHLLGLMRSLARPAALRLIDEQGHKPRAAASS